MDDYLKANQAWWNKATSVHANSKLYGVEEFKKGKSNLNTIELEELKDVKGKTLLHLQCHFGMGTISWVREGAIATGVDLSDESIKLAKKLSEEVGVPVDFICSDLYNLPEVLNKKFDIVFTSYGVLAWLPDIKKWAKVVSHFLKEGGTFYIAEIHPLTNIFSKDFKITDSYFKKDPYIEGSGPDYADEHINIESKTFEWTHPLGNIVSALTGEGLKIEFLHEFPFTVYDQFPGLLKEDGKGYWKFKDQNIEVPLLFSIKACKQS